MANVLYPLGVSKLLSGDLDWDSDDFVVALLDGSYVYSDLHEFASSLTGSVIGDAPMTGNVVIDDGIADSDDLSITGVSASLILSGIAIYRDTGSLATSPLLYFADENSDTTPIEQTTTGAAIPVIWSASPERVFKV